MQTNIGEVLPIAGLAEEEESKPGKKKINIEALPVNQVIEILKKYGRL